MKIDKTIALNILEKALKSKLTKADSAWLDKIEKLTKFCNEAGVQTHIAFFGTICLANAINTDFDLFAIKPAHSNKNDRSFSARSLCHGILVPFSVDNDIDLGVHGREPLNNQPYFRMTHLGDSTPIHSKSKECFNFVLKLARELTKIKNEEEARQVLKVFLHCRKKVNHRFAPILVKTVSIYDLKKSISKILKKGSASGKVAQAITAGLLDAYVGKEFVSCGKANDPSLKYPGDVFVNFRTHEAKNNKAIEVRDKCVSISDVKLFANECKLMKVSECAILMTAPNQTRLDKTLIEEFGSKNNILITLFYGMDELLDHLYFWNSAPREKTTNSAITCIQERLIQSEITSDYVSFWSESFLSLD